MSPAPDPALVARFKAALDRLNPGGGKIGLAVSGGPDSMAMLLLAHVAIPGRFEVATVNHGLRAEAADECALVAAACAERGVDCAVLEVTVRPGNVQARAREARYAALAEWAFARNLRAVATAHHADDQAETILMRLLRGSGLVGLTGVRSSSLIAGITVIRPLLNFRHSELAAACEGAGIMAVADLSNENTDFDRVRIRQAIAACDWLDAAGLSTSATYLAEAQEFVQDTLSSLWQGAVTPDGDQFRYWPGATNFERIEVVRMILQRSGTAPVRSDIARMVERLSQGQNASLGGMLACVKDGEWLFRPEPPRRTG
ncbi:tRNA lysidine(34) synthetase TilS [Alteraurantiacibacter buctensis]|uniref:tRNA(Ile)-lysidine synthase n=1 Tax=Alteraurantiacibacter buctensis TaxID=1503981 RepID=A0A844Z137_9SPHN|nr:tRNA lysidine(34) synthetase TilS [Alteraurantiacibacter buctensis]